MFTVLNYLIRLAFKLFMLVVLVLGSTLLSTFLYYFLTEN